MSSNEICIYSQWFVTSGERSGAEGEVLEKLFAFKHSSRLFEFSTMSINSHIACVIMQYHQDPETDLL